MKGIVTLMIFICLLNAGAVAQPGTSKATMKKKGDKTAVKKTTPKKEVHPRQQKKESKKEVEKEVVASAGKEELVLPAPSDSEVTHNKSDSEVNNTVHTAPRQDKDNVVVSSVSPIAANKSMSGWQMWIPWVSLVLVVGVGIYTVLADSNINNRLSGIQRYLNAQKTDLEWTKAKHQPGVSSAEVENLISASPTVRRILDECSAIRSDMAKLQQPLPKMVSVAPVEEATGGTFYMTGPTNNYFPSSARSNHRENTVYKFILQPGGNEARFELHTTGASINEIIKVVESYIKPACDEENLPSSGTRNILTRKQGVAILENEKWIIKDKAIIRYE